MKKRPFHLITPIFLQPLSEKILHEPIMTSITSLPKLEPKEQEYHIIPPGSNQRRFEEISHGLKKNLQA